MKLNLRIRLVLASWAVKSALIFCTCYNYFECIVFSLLKKRGKLILSAKRFVS